MKHRGSVAMLSHYHHHLSVPCHSKSTRLAGAWLYSPWAAPGLPVLLCCVLEQLSQLQWVFADLLHRREEEAIQSDVDHLLEQAAGLEEVPVLAVLHEVRQLHTGAWVVVAVLRVDGKALLLEGKATSSVSGSEPTVKTCLERRGTGQDPKGSPGSTLAFTAGE